MIEKIALKFLAIRSYSSYEFKKKLLSKKFSLQEIEKIIHKYIDQGFINDKELAHRRTQAYKNKGYGPKWIVQKLKTQKLPLGPYNLDEQLDIIRRCLEKPLFHKKTKIEQISSLEKRGFSLKAIFQVISLKSSYSDY